ncbi:histone-lysine N-methyltransferase SETD7-like [Rhopilema esculentum]|uniref:histone-lysine N-methyltransferase SETD7-like n=1 Tax=Rhopilema esculentum TaxID=499914 RepID=UPI0031D79DFC|eukprot:gene267-9915_t
MDYSTDNTMESEDEDEGIYHGQTNEMGCPHGRGTTVFSNGSRFEGKFNNGVKEGRGTFFFADGSCLSGNYIDDALFGKAIYTYEDGSKLVGTYVDGELNGPAEEFHASGDISFRGNYTDNIRNGLCHFWDEFGGHIFGEVNESGQLSGDDIIYVYPDKETALKGRFQDGELIQAQLATKISPEKKSLEFRIHIPAITFRRDVSTKEKISEQPLLSDPFEIKRTYVKKSEISNAGEGLFARKYIGPDEIVSFYNGVRIPHEEVDARDWRFNGNTISLDDEIVIDVPEGYSSTEVYCATLGHKANHSFTPNAKYDRFDHPRFGRIKCIRTIKSVEADEELTVEYGYDHNGLGKNNPEAPQWYKSQLKQLSS